MSQSTLPEQVPSTNPEEKPLPESNPVDTTTADFDLDYKPIPILAPVAMFLGVASFAGLMGLFGLVLSAVGILVSLGAYLQIKASKGHFGGTKFAVAGGLLSVTFLVTGAYMMYTDYHTELPPGFQRVNFPKEIAEKGFLEIEGQRKLHPDVETFVEQPLFLKGYIWQSQSYNGGFVLLKDNGDCCFGGSPAPNDMIFVRLEPGTPFKYISGLVAVAGTLHADPNAIPGEPVYVMDAKHVNRAKTVF